MGSLGDAMPENVKQQFIFNLAIGIRNVFRFYQTNTNPPKPKFCIIVGFCDVDNTVAVIYINSELNLNVNYNPYLQSLHIPILRTNYDWLVNDSYIDCSMLYEKSITELTTILNESIEKHFIGELSDLHIEDAKNKLKSSKKLSTYMKKKYSLI